METRLPYQSAAGLQLTAVVSAGARRIRAVFSQLGAWMKARRRARAAMEVLSAMSDRELCDIGIARSDVERVACEHPGPRP